MAGNISVTRNYDRIFTAALDRLTQDVLFDTVTARIAYLFRLRDMGAIVFRPGGTNLNYAIYKEAVATQGYTDLDVLDIVRGDPMTRAQYGWRQLATPIHISGLDMIRTANATIALLDVFIEQAILSMRDTLSDGTTGLFSNGGDGDARIITGLQQLVSITNTSGSIGQVSRTNTFWQNQSQNVSSDFSGNGFDRMTTLALTCSRGDEVIDTIVLTRAAFELFLKNSTRTFRVNEPLEQKVADEGMVEMGFPHARFHGAVIIFDDGVGANLGYFLNLKKKFVHLVVQEDRAFAIKGLISPADRDALTGHVLWAGNQVATNLPRLGVLRNADTN